MGIVEIQDFTTKIPLQMMGYESGVCVNADVSDSKKNIRRGLDCIYSGHGRVLEYPQIYMTMDGYSARVIREFYTHIGGDPTRLQASTRYINYEDGFDYVIPPSANSPEQILEYDVMMECIKSSLQKLEELQVPREDCAMGLPLGMTTKVTVRTNLRNLVDMSRQRMCTRAYWEYRQLFKDIIDALSSYSKEWAFIVAECFKPKCEVYGYCTEKKCCGRKPYKEPDRSNEKKFLSEILGVQ